MLAESRVFYLLDLIACDLIVGRCWNWLRLIVDIETILLVILIWVLTLNGVAVILTLQAAVGQRIEAEWEYVEVGKAWVLKLVWVINWRSRVWLTQVRILMIIIDDVTFRLLISK